MPFGIGPWEIAVVVIIALVVFGPKRLPELGSSLGKAITGFKSGLKSSEEEIRAALKDDASAVPADQAQTVTTPAVAVEPVAQAAVQPVAQPVAVDAPAADAQTAPGAPGAPVV
jgi:sec-independent protein translocase protein TatA